MKITIETLSAIYRIAKHIIYSDGSFDNDEAQKLLNFFMTFEAMDEDKLKLIMDHGTNGMDDIQAISLVSALDDEAKQQISTLFAQIVCADGNITQEEKDLYFKVADLCGLPDPGTGEEEKEEEEKSYDNDVIPAFIVVNYYGIASFKQSENEDWGTLGDEIASWLGCDRVEVVRFTGPLNALTEKLSLNGRHLVFMVARNGYGDKTVGDNMPATILYGGGYPLYGNMAIALETDQGYKIEGIRSSTLFDEVYNAVNEAVGGLIRTEES